VHHVIVPVIVAQSADNKSACEKGRTMHKLTLALAAFAALFGASAAQADSFPSHPITLMVGFPPGGPTDALARLLAKGMEEKLGQTIVVETVSGASGTIATGRVVHAAPDGYTIGIGNWSSHVGSPQIYKLDYDIQTDLAPISLLAYSPLLILGKNAIPPNNAKELIAWLKAKPSPATFGTVGTGSAAQLGAVSFAKAIGVKFDYVPYRGAGPAITDLVGGHIDLSCLEASASLPFVTAHKFKAFAVVNEKRWPKLPDVPTTIEAGAPGVSLPFWHGLWTTKGTPPDIVARLDGAVQAALANPSIKDRLAQLGQVIFPADQQNPAALAAYEKAELAKWAPIIKAAGIKAQ
jgi:tripartite-type tricarboxylate transporter receptor subunit TctC